MNVKLTNQKKVPNKYMKLNGESTISINKLLTVQTGLNYNHACFNRDDTEIITYDYNTYQRWDIKTSQHLGEVTVDDPDYAYYQRLLMMKCSREYTEKERRVDALWYGDSLLESPNSQLVAIGNNCGRLYMQDIANNMPYFLCGHNTSMNNHMHQNSIEHLCFDPTSRYLISIADEDGYILLWDLHATGEASKFRGREGIMLYPAANLAELSHCTYITFSHQGARLVVGWSGGFEIWELIHEA